MNKKRSSLKYKTLKRIIVFALGLVVALSTLVGWQFFAIQVSAQSRQAFNLTRTAASYIDGDRIPGYVETEEKDDYYYEILDYLNAAQLEAGVKYYYVFVPYEDDLVYVWDAQNNKGAQDLGVHEDYMSDESKAASLQEFRKDPPEEINLQRDAVYGHIASAYSPVFNSAGEPVALVGVDLAVDNVYKNIWLFVLLIFMVTIFVTILAVVPLFKAIDRNVITPISMLTESTARMVESLEDDSSVELDIHTGDEIEELANAIVKMDGDLRVYVRELAKVTAERERMGTELNVAKTIQEGMLPRVFPPFPDRDEFDLYASMVPAWQVGGDFYDFFMVDDDHIALVMADVSGKGIPASLFMAISKVLIKNSVQAGLSPGQALEQVNPQLLEGNDAGLFVTVWLAVIDIKTGKGVAANAGHEHPVLKKAGGDFEMVKYKHSLAVAAIEGVKFREHGFELEPGDCLFVYTDGVPESANERNELMGEARMLDALNKYKDVDPSEFLPSIMNEIEIFADGAAQADDITMMIFRYNGSHE